MTSLPETTKHRLKRIPQIPHVWEGDRRSIMGMMENLETDLVDHGECIIWVDGSEGFVRSMDVMNIKTGPEAMVRTLLKAIENPHNPAKPARPQKIVVKDRELQFFLRGALQGLDIIVDYQSELPLLDELWQNFQSIHTDSNENISPELSEALEKIAISEIWDQQPWHSLSEEEIIKIDINHWNVDSLYACVMGMLGQEFGVILYRSLDSMKKFRQQVIDLADSADEGELEAIFLQQDCWFVNFSQEDGENFYSKGDNFSENNIGAIFGSIHPYEGIRPLREEEEVYPVYLAIQALGRFLRECEEELSEQEIDFISKEYTLNIPLEDLWLKINVSTTPELTKELEELFGDEDDEDDYYFEEEDEPEINDTLIPEGTLVSFSKMEASLFNSLQGNSSSNIPLKTFEKIKNKASKSFFPVIILQTTRPKAQTIIEELIEEDGVLNVTFNEGYDPYKEVNYTLGILQTLEENFYIFAQIQHDHEDDNFIKQLNEWREYVAKFYGYCGIVIAMGAKGSSRGNPQPKDILHLFYGELIDREKLGFGKLVLQID
ncbi:hypothetical protein GM3708_2444 [Geminocystis sp. NIES-3708]|uniref:DUF6930 domain-containing protein n=1 Tax=Geminocystis sp. NIES-3708 TaxID=1615909 RepID=UPI0005FC5BE9|nr:hypothetical protein [Geminocystis sp. NIES-3708]BAQ62038.1 hypothetical protein GM3708_2444 [Geminocystis sp. NIES-3708]